MPYSVMLDAGHGGSDPGAVYNGRQEKDDTLRLTLAVGEILQNNGIFFPPNITSHITICSILIKRYDSLTLILPETSYRIVFL